MKKITKVLLSTFLALMILFTMAPTAIHASETWVKPDNFDYEYYRNGKTKIFEYGLNGVRPGIDRNATFFLKNYQEGEYTDYWVIGECQEWSEIFVHFKYGDAEKLTLRAIDILNNKIAYELTYPTSYNGDTGHAFILDLPPGAYRFLIVNHGTKTLALDKYVVSIG